ncbi:hypothetical protein B0H14DRAFT_2567387 [Mycena olivaceomarginata]|nr:hypothetical protein B0H14DRAFT_2567387 [Mycena olivaceomarginata]
MPPPRLPMGRTGVRGRLLAESQLVSGGELGTPSLANYLSGISQLVSGGELGTRLLQITYRASASWSLEANSEPVSCRSRIGHQPAGLWRRTRCISANCASGISQLVSGGELGTRLLQITYRASASWSLEANLEPRLLRITYRASASWSLEANSEPVLCKSRIGHQPAGLWRRTWTRLLQITYRASASWSLVFAVSCKLRIGHLIAFFGKSTQNARKVVSGTGRLVHEPSCLRTVHAGTSLTTGDYGADSDADFAANPDDTHGVERWPLFSGLP